MPKITVNPLVLGVGALVLATTGTTVLADDADAALNSQSVVAAYTITGAHGDGDKDGDDEGGEDEEGKCGEGKCGEGKCGEEEEGEEEEES